MSVIVALDFFAGIGGFRLGLERAGGYTVPWACEWAKAPRRVYADHWQEAPQGCDIRDVRPEDLPEADVWVGGFPCQDVSDAGAGKGLLAGKRSGLVFRWLGLAAVRRPQWLLMENVPGLLRPGRGFDRLLAILARLGYGFAWRTLDAQCFGLAQRRQRVFLLACLDPAAGRERAARVLLESDGVRGDPRACRAARADDPRAAEIRPRRGRVAGCVTAHAGRNDASTETPVVAKAVTASAGKSSRSGDQTFGVAARPVPATVSRGAPVPRPADVASTVGTNGGGCRGSHPGTLVAFDRAQLTHPENRSRPMPGDPVPTVTATAQPCIAWSVFPENGQGADLRVAPCDVSPGVTATDGRSDRGVRVQVAAGVRRLAPVEVERLFGFPDGWTAVAGSLSARYRCLGNSVAVPVVEWTARRLRAEAEGA